MDVSAFLLPAVKPSHNLPPRCDALNSLDRNQGSQRLPADRFKADSITTNFKFVQRMRSILSEVFDGLHGMNIVEIELARAVYPFLLA